MIIFSILLLFKVAQSSEDICRLLCPASLSFIEKLNPILNASDIVIFTGGDSLERRQSGHANISANSIEAFANHHGYGLVFIDKLNYNFHMMYKGQKYSPQWHKVFCMPALRHKYASAKYYVWIDDDVMVPYPQTDMLNHYINLVDRTPDWEMMFGDEGRYYVMNSGFFIMKNTPFTQSACQLALDIGLERDGRLAKKFGHEQEAFVLVRQRHSFCSRIRVISHRDGPYNFNTFARHVKWDTREMVALKGDAFVHFLGSTGKLKRMNEWIEYIDEWRLYTEGCLYPLKL